MKGCIGRRSSVLQSSVRPRVELAVNWNATVRVASFGNALRANTISNLFSGDIMAVQAAVSGRRYVPAVGSRLRVLLWIVFAIVGVLGANSVYLACVTALEAATGRVYQNWFYLVMFAGHLALGGLLVTPLVAFGLIHMVKSRHRKNRRAVRVGYVLLAASLAVLVSGILLIRLPGLFDLKQPLLRSTVYWLHVGCPLACLWLYWLHRLAGRRIHWRIGAAYAGVVAASVGLLVAAHNQDPRQWNVSGPAEGTQYFEPSLARTATGNFIPATALQNDADCQRCHADAHTAWADSAHRFSSFNNPAYRASVRETRAVALERDGNVKASRWCAGCHDPVPFFSGAFDDPKFDDVAHPTAHAGITCTVCHAITHVGSPRGNADFTIEEPERYPFANSENAALSWLNGQLIKAKPALHKKTFLKPLHKSAEFCATCHKVHLPFALTHYKEFLRGQNHYDSYLLSGVSGHGARSFYYPPVAQENCNECHMPRTASNDFGARPTGPQGQLEIHDHLFASSNTALPWLRGDDAVIARHRQFLQGIARVDLFGVREQGRIDGELHAPLRPQVPTLQPGGEYLFETVIRTLKVGHHFTQGTIDSNEVWLDVTVRSGDRILGRSGAQDDAGEVDRWAHYVNAFLIDRDGNRINRRNPQDIFVKVYDHQIPPGAGQTVHYGFIVPDDLTAPLTVAVKLQYRKFDAEYMQIVAAALTPRDAALRGAKPGQVYKNTLPIITLAADEVTFPIAGVAEDVQNPPRDIPTWQRWNDYGIGLFLKGKAELRQAADAFAAVETLDRYDGPLNLARVLHREGRIDEATAALGRAAAHHDPPPPAWTTAWLAGVLNREQGRLHEAAANLRSVLTMRTPETVERHFDFSKDYEVINLLGQTLFDLGRQQRAADRAQERQQLFKEAAEQFNQTLSLDPENVAAHYNLMLLYRALGDEAQAEEQQRLHGIYKVDDNAADRAVRLARQKYPGGR